MNPIFVKLRAGAAKSEAREELSDTPIDAKH